MSPFFSLNGIYVRLYLDDRFLITSDDRMQYRKLGVMAPSVSIPIFPVDLSDKDKLFNKLKTYLIFS